VGRGPTKELPLRSRYVRAVRVESVEGRLPVMEFFQMERKDNLAKPPRYEGREPANEFAPRLSPMRPERTENEVVIVPERRLVLTLKYVRLVKIETEEGMVPTSKFEKKFTEIKFVSEPREEGRVPAS
jgi:hypothetical protein